MSYLPAFHLTDGVFVRCRDCAAIVYQSDTATHDAWHEDIEAKIAKAAKTAGKPSWRQRSDFGVVPKEPTDE